ncbi:MurR/RpiR family transcriptional regulator [Rhizobium sp. P32RR-XVIII]|uniref:MurR/RpiR family transcriptional regulator n=1 Tax=Rhizobium sp. P32RR-XVIII TaxID=2726738 RepID=UPI001456A983|nr:MurR/RpiR family transcriptional regulator [Rhizobium sp. P32RR-XVIII]NLS07285.1 MurR/RpiR family transcriptional regulator [Rhizobium sp. P32RR-XVIII]
MDRVYYSEVAQLVAKAYDRLSPGHRRIAEFILQHPAEAAMLNNVELAARCEVSNATANRFPKALGFPGFAEFRSSQRDALRTDLSPANKLRDEIDESASHFEVIRNGLQQDLGNLETTLAGIDEASCARAVELILSAERIFAYGAGLSRYIAGLLIHGLEPFCRGNATDIGAAGGANSALRRVVHCNKKDLLIIASFPRYAADTLEIAKIGRENDATIICLTDRPTSPLSKYADIVFYAQADRKLLPNSVTAAVALAEGIIAAVANRRSEGINVHMRLAENQRQD